MHQSRASAALQAHRGALDAKPPRKDEAARHMEAAQREIANATRLDNRPMPIDKRRGGR